MTPSRRRPTIGVLIRFANSEHTLPTVLQSLGSQTLPPDAILGVASASSDRSREILVRSGARVIEWTGPYHHSRVLNHGCRNLATDLILVLSSHTVLESPRAIETLAACFDDPRVCCASPKWDRDPFYSNDIDWSELVRKGMRFGSIYTNSMGMIRSRCWRETPFDESTDTSEDYAWAVERLKRGDRCRRLELPFSHLRQGSARDREFADFVFAYARRQGLPVTWLGPKGSAALFAKSILTGRPRHEWDPVWQRLVAWGRCREVVKTWNCGRKTTAGEVMRSPAPTGAIGEVS